VADIADEGNKLDPGAGARGRRHRNLDGKFATIPVQRGEFGRLSQELALTGFDEPGQTALMELAVAARNDGRGERPADRLVM
jgi:hypothetical protein